jgi:hypothetical protein
METAPQADFRYIAVDALEMKCEQRVLVLTRLTSMAIYRVW